MTVPAVYALAISHADFADTDVSAVARVAYGGAPIAPALVERIKKAFPAARVGNGFGLTETASIATYLPDEWSAEHADSVGFAAPVVDLRVAEPDPESGVGELLIRGPERRVRLLEQARRDRRAPSSTAGCTPATSRASTTRASSTSSTAPRT